jgi:signal transduction histidine kinase
MLSPFIVESLVFDPGAGVFREVYWSWINVHIGLHILFILGFIGASFYQLTKQKYLNKQRLERILGWSFLLLLVLITLQLILPTFDIWIFEREIIFTFPMFAIYTHYAINRWYFHSYGYGVWRLAILGLAMTIALLGVIWFKKWSGVNWSSGAINYWLIEDSSGLLGVVLGVTLYMASSFILKYIFLGHNSTDSLKKQLQSLKNDLSSTKSLDDLNRELSGGMTRIFKTKYSQIHLGANNIHIAELTRFFIKNRKERIFLKDLIFIEEKKRLFNSKKLLQELPDEAYLAFPLFDHTIDNQSFGVCILGVKPFGDAYSWEELEILQEFMLTLELHLRYIDTYSQLRDLTVHLDQKVDEKTFDYNQLINRQKEFIHLISHEIKSPIANAIFQIDSILDDLDLKPVNMVTIEQDLESLNTSLIGMGDLTNKLFAVEYFDIRSVSLFREKIQIVYMLQTELEICTRMHETIEFINEIDTDIGFISVDRIQLQQVITNILGNAIKFVATAQHPIIRFTAKRTPKFLTISLEDNGPWFGLANPETFFEKYAVGNSQVVGLWMGLYLCKKIVEMHGGTITASPSPKLWGAKIYIEIPVN